MTEVLQPAAQNQQFTPPTASAELRRETMDVLHNEHRILDDTVAPLYPPEDIGMPAEINGKELSVIGELALPGDMDDPSAQDSHIAILKVKDAKTGQIRYAMQGLTVNETGEATRATIRPVVIGSAGNGLGRTTLGRSLDTVAASELWGTKAGYSPAVSRQHVELFATKHGLVVRDMSAHGTRINMRKNDAIDERFKEGHTTYATEMAHMRGHMSEDGKFANRLQITRDTEVRDGMVDNRSRYAGKGAESIVVDSKSSLEDAKEYGKLYQLFENKLLDVERWSGQKPSENAVLEAMYESVAESLDYDLAFVDAFTEDTKAKVLNGRDPSKIDLAHLKVNLSIYLAEGKGVCRHMALAVAWLGGRAKDSGLLTGCTTAGANQDNVDMAAHEWARYTATDGKVYILDPAQKFFGSLEDSMQGNRWHYFRKGEYQAYQKKLGGKPVQRLIESMPYDWAKDPGSF